MPHSTRRILLNRVAVAGTRQCVTSGGDSDSWLEELGRRATITPSGCWQVGDDPNAYQTLHLHGRSTNAHRAVYEAVHEVSLPPHIHVHHTCETPACINLAHLVALTDSDHMSLHGRKRSRMWSSITTK